MATFRIDTINNTIQVLDADPEKIVDCDILKITDDYVEIAVCIENEEFDEFAEQLDSGEV